MKVYDAVANAFVKEGTTAVFGLMGDGNMSCWHAMAKHPGVKTIDVRHESAALTMAEGWARATGKTGVCCVTQGPGVSHMTSSLIAATRSRMPVVVCTSKTAFNNERASQYLDQSKLVDATGAGYIEIMTPGYAENAVRQAFYSARLQSRPFVLCVPHDIQGKEYEGDGDDYLTSEALFAGQQRIRPDRDRLNEAVKIIASSKKPVVVIGRGALELSARQAADRLAKRVGALIATTLIAKGALGESDYHAGISGTFSTRAVMQLFDEADCVIAIGAGLNVRTIGGGYLYPNAKVIHIDIAPHILMGNDRSADCYIQGDAAVTTQEIDDMLAKEGVSNVGYRTAEVRHVLRDADRDPAEYEIEPGTIDPREVARVMDECLPSDVGLVTGDGHFYSFPIMIMKKARAPQMYITEYGCIGQALPSAIGACVALNQPIVCMEGDGGAMQNIQELDTAARLGLQLLYVIINDEGFGAEYHKLVATHRDPSLSLIRSPDLGAVSRGFGCRGKMARTLDEVRAGIKEFLSGKGPMVLDVRVSRNVINIPYRRVHYGEDV